MSATDRKNVAADDIRHEQERAVHEKGEPHDDTCRCKETSRMTPRELLELMFRDLAVWKKSKKD
jgi:hypothetical protein